MGIRRKVFFWYTICYNMFIAIATVKTNLKATSF